jgi:exoribonuclease II
MILRANSLVLYKGRPAIIKQAFEKKLTIELGDGHSASVRPKDVTLLHPGPIGNLLELQPVSGDALTARELLDGQSTTLSELTELTYGVYTPSTAWAAWQLVEEGIYFSGSPEAINTHDSGKVEEILAARRFKAAEEEAWLRFVAEVTAGMIPADGERYLADVIDLAQGRSETSRVLGRLGKPQTPESAHEFLLAIGWWTPAVNPHPIRLSLPTESPVLFVERMPATDRRDLTHLLALAIDDEGSNDPDDAISLDGERLWVHIADAAVLVTPDNPIDLEARNRGANLYLPEGTVRMLPDEVTDQLALGLQPESPALSFAFSSSPNGETELLEIVRSRIKVTRTTYEAAELELDQPPYRALSDMAAGFLQRRVANGAIEIDLPEVKIKVSPDGQVSVRPLPPLDSRQLVRESMLMVGEAVGRLGLEHEIPLAYTFQAPPQVLETPASGLAGMFAQRRAMQRSQQRTTPGRHAGLGLDVYVQATSPLRRYLDLVAHQQLRTHLAGEEPMTSAEVTLRIGLADAVTSAVRTAERLSNQHWILVYLLQNPVWEGDGVVVEHKPGREIVLIPDLAWETELYQRRPQELNSVVRLAIESVDIPNRQARFKLI